MIRAKDVMTTTVNSIRPNTTIRETIAILTTTGITGVPVTDRDGGLIGIITEFGLMEALYNPAIMDDAVSGYMTEDVITVKENEALTHVATLFLVHRIRRLPVLRDGVIVGIISRRDLLKVAHDRSEAITERPDRTAQLQPVNV